MLITLSTRGLCLSANPQYRKYKPGKQKKTDSTRTYAPCNAAVRESIQHPNILKNAKARGYSQKGQMRQKRVQLSFRTPSIAI